MQHSRHLIHFTWIQIRQRRGQGGNAPNNVDTTKWIPGTALDGLRKVWQCQHWSADNPRLFLAFLFWSPHPSHCQHHGQLYSFIINQIIFIESVLVSAAPISIPHFPWEQCKNPLQIPSQEGKTYILQWPLCKVGKRSSTSKFPSYFTF